MKDIAIELIPTLPRSYNLTSVYRDKYTSIYSGTGADGKSILARATIIGFGIHVTGGKLFKNKLLKLVSKGASAIVIRNFVLEEMLRYLSRGRHTLLFKLLLISKSYGVSEGEEKTKVYLSDKFSDLMKKHLLGE